MVGHVCDDGEAEGKEKKCSWEKAVVEKKSRKKRGSLCGEGPSKGMCREQGSRKRHTLYLVRIDDGAEVLL